MMRILFTILVAMGVATGTAHAQMVDFRAGSGAVADSAGNVQVWTSTNGPLRAISASAASAPVLIPNAVNGQPALGFDGTRFMGIEGYTFPGNGSSYTAWIVANWNGTAGANNMLSGNTRAIWLANNAYPQLIHNVDFVNQAASAAPMQGWCIVRVEYDGGTGKARLGVNNAMGGWDTVPANPADVAYIGAFQGGNCFNGMIAHVRIRAGNPADAEVTAMDSELHERYAIPRMRNRTSGVAFSVLPKNDQLYATDQELHISGIALTDSLRSIRIIIEANGEQVDRHDFATAGAGHPITYRTQLSAGLREYRVVIIANHRASTDTAADIRHILCGEPIAVCGQSNSIYGAPSLGTSPWCRTFGSNFSSSRSDTAFSASVADGYGGGSNVGAWALTLQKKLAAELSLPTCVINGGVGGTTIQQHLPYAMEDLGTIYGSWLMRLRKSGLQNHIRWMFWYQGESNGGAEDYTTMFTTLRSQWLQDMPNLRHVVIVQIRPGCGQPEHGRLREQMRQLSRIFPDLIVHAAAGLPDHDGCHYAANGYETLGNQFFEIFTATVSSGTLRPASPDLLSVHCVDEACTTIDVAFDGASGLHFTETATGRSPLDAFMISGQRHPTSVELRGDTVRLSFATAVDSLTYVPDTYYTGTETIYEGPWLVNAYGVGALTFYGIVPNRPTSVREPAIATRSMDAYTASEAARLFGATVAYDVRGTVHSCMNLTPGIYALLVSSSATRLVAITGR